MSGAEAAGGTDASTRGGSTRPSRMVQLSKIALLLGLGLAALEIAAILSRPGVSKASPYDLAVLATWLAIPYAAGLGLAAALLAAVVTRIVGGSFAGVVAGSGSAIAVTVWLRMLTRLGASGGTRLILEILIVLVAIGAGCACGMAVARFEARGNRRTGTPTYSRAWAGRALVVALILWAAWGGIEFFELLSPPGPGPGGSSRGPEAAGAAHSPNVLLISIDTLRADHLSCYGYGSKTSPAIDQLAAEGILFRKTSSTASFTLPAHASMLTGLFPSAHGATYQNRDPSSLVVRGMGRGYPTLGEILREKGYETAGFVSGPLLSHQFGFARGFDTYDDRYDRLQSARARLFSRSLMFRLLMTRGLFSSRDLDSQRTADEVNPLVTGWLSDRPDPAKPFLLFVHYWDPHGPYAPPSPYNQRPDGTGITAEYDMDQLLTGQYTLTPEALSDNLALYDGEIRYVDQHVGALLADLRRRGLYDNTLIILTSDHGESFGEHDHWEHSRVLYEDVLHVPFIMRLPSGRGAGTIVTDTIAQPTDILPSVLSLAGIPLPEGIQGRDLTGRLTGQTVDDTSDPIHHHALAFAELDRNTDWPRRWGKRYDRDLVSVQTTTWKYIQSSTGQHELYDLGSDPKELDNRATAEPEMLNTLKGLLDLWRRSVGGRDQGETEEIDEGLKENLRGLGYIQ